MATEFKKVQKVIKANPGIFKRVDDIEIPDILFQTIKSGTPEFDNSYSELGGVTPSCVTLITGTPGAGKTTLMSVLGSRLQSPKPVVFMCYEMSDFQLKMAGKKIPGFNKMLLVTEDFHKTSKEAFTNFLNGPLKDLEPSMVIVDSLQKMAGVMHGSYNANQIWLTEQLTKFAKDTFTPVNMIGHVNKDGSYKGPTTIKHEVDAHMHLWVDKEINERMFGFTKNRFGGVADPYVFRITGHGVYIGEEWWMKAAGDMPNEAKNAIAEFRGISSKMEYVPFNAFQKMAKTVHKWLSTLYKEQLERDTVSGRVNTKLTWKGKKAFCRIGSGTINYGEKFFKTITNSNWKGVGYKTEKDYINRHCENKEDIALWVIFHEFQHLFKGNDKHVKSFFQSIENRYAAHKTTLKPEITE